MKQQLVISEKALCCVLFFEEIYDVLSEMDLKAQLFLHVSFGKWYLTFVFVFNVLSLLSR